MKKLLLSGMLLLISMPAWAFDYNLQVVTGPTKATICPNGDGNSIEYYFRVTDYNDVPNPMTGLTIRVRLQDYTTSQAVFFCPSGGRTTPEVVATEEGNGYYRVSLGHPAGGVNRTTQSLSVVFAPDGLNPKFRNLDVNSPDLTGDRRVNLSDTIQYSQIYNGGVYSFWIDFNNDGLNNLTDTTIFSQHNGHICQ